MNSTRVEKSPPFRHCDPSLKEGAAIQSSFQPPSVIPAEAGIQSQSIDSRFRGNDTVGLLYLVFLFFLICTSLAAQAGEETQKYEAYLNSIKTLTGEFTQVSSQGGMLTGSINMSRPGKIRLEYDAPSSLLIISDGKWLINYDREADEKNYVSLDSTPAGFILRPVIRFHGDVEVTSVLPKQDTTEISLVRKEEPEAGTITLVFNDAPLSLKEWSILDSQNRETRVLLSDVKTNVRLPDHLFSFESPNLIQQLF